MGKKKDAKKRAALEAREAEIAAELARREAEKAKAKKAKKKAGKKKKSKAPVEVAALDIAGGTVESGLVPAEERHPHLAHLDRVGELSAIVNDPTAKKKAKAEAAAELARMRDESAARMAESDAELKAKVAAKRAAREALAPRPELPDPATVDRADEEAVRAYNAEAVKVGATLLTSDAEREKAAKHANTEPEPEPEPVQAVEAVETETGRVFEAGESVATDKPEDIALPSEAEPVLESGRNGYKIIQLDKDGKPDPRTVRQFTRITTYVGNIDDETALKAWDKRMVAEGLAADSIAPESAELFAKVNDITHRRDVAIAKATKADRKGKLGIGEVGRLIAAAEKEAKTALDAIVEEAAHLAGRNDKANFGTHLHTLAEIADMKGIDAVRELHESGELVAHDNDGRNEGLEPMPVTATDLASIEAYTARMRRLGATVLHSEAVVVNDELRNAGRLDRILMAKLPELVVGKGTPEEYVRPADTRARRYVADIKSGSLEYSAGKIARQLAAYAVADLYDLATGERTSHRAVKDIALVFHLPLGEGTCSVYAVDLKAGIRMLKLSGDVRRARNTGKKAIDLTVDIADPSTATDGEGE